MKQQGEKSIAIERRLEPARSQEGRQLPPDLAIRYQAKNAQPKKDPEERIEQPFAPRSRPLLGRQQTQNVGLFEPHATQMIDRKIMRQCARENDAADAACRRSCDAVNNHPQVKLAADALQKRQIDFLGVHFAFAGSIQRYKAPGLAMVWIGCRVVRLRCARELEDFLDDAVHVKHERHTAVADECEPQFLFSHERTPRGNLASLLSSNELGMRSIGNRILQWRAGLAVASRRVRRERAGAQLFTAPRASMPLPATEFRAGRRSDKRYGTSRHFAILQTGWREGRKAGRRLGRGECVNERRE